MKINNPPGNITSPPSPSPSPHRHPVSHLALLVREAGVFGALFWPKRTVNGGHLAISGAVGCCGWFLVKTSSASRLLWLRNVEKVALHGSVRGLWLRDCRCMEGQINHGIRCLIQLTMELAMWYLHQVFHTFGLVLAWASRHNNQESCGNPWKKHEQKNSTLLRSEHRKPWKST